MAIINYRMSSHASTSYFTGEAWCDKNGKALPCKIQTAGHGKFGNGWGSVHSDVYPDGVYQVEVGGARRGHPEIVIRHYAIDGTSSVFPHEDLAPENVRRFAVKFAVEADCYHCKCLQAHLQRASE